MDRFERFTDRARMILTLAQQEAQRFNHTHIGTEHILLGLIGDADAVAARVLANLGVERLKVRRAIEFIIGRGDRPTIAQVGLTPRAKRVIELAIDESRRLGHRHIGSEHLLLGLVREGEGIAAGVLASLGVTLDRARDEVARVRAAGASDEPRPRNVVPMTLIAEQLPPGELERVLEASRSHVDVESSPLRRVVAIGQATSASGISVELIALEVRGEGAILHWKARWVGARTLGQPDVSVADDVGTAYRVQPSGFSGTQEALKGELLFVPAPPERASLLRVRLNAFAGRPFPGPALVTPDAEQAAGPWLFEFPIRA